METMDGVLCVDTRDSFRLSLLLGRSNNAEICGRSGILFVRDDFLKRCQQGLWFGVRLLEWGELWSAKSAKMDSSNMIAVAHLSVDSNEVLD